MRDIASELIDQQSKLASNRSTYDQHCREVAQLVLDRQDDFFGSSNRPDGEKRTERQFDPTGAAALEKFAAAMESMLTPRSSKWHGLTADDDRLNQNDEVRRWLDNVNDLLFRVRYSSKANFASQQHENYMSLGAFGTAVMIIEDNPGVGIRYKSSHIAEHYFMENAHGRIDCDYRKYKMTARQAAQKFGLGNLPEVIQRALDKNPSEKFDFLHAVFPNEDLKPGMEGEKGYAFSSFHIACDGKKLLGRGGFRTFPFAISRYVTSPNEIYGRSPGMTALSEMKMLNQMRKTDLRARHLSVDPPILAANEQTLRRLRMQPHAINYGALDSNGNPLVRPYTSDTRIDLSNDAINQSREMINDVFLVTLFQILVDSPQMTATEVLQRAQEKGALLSPTMGRQQSEALGPMIEREISILEQYGYFLDDGPFPMPEALKERGGQYGIEYTSPLSRMQKSDEALGTERVLQSALPFAQIDPSIMDNFDLDAYIDIIGQANGAPARLFRPQDQKAALRQNRQNQQAMEKLVAAAPGVAGSMKDIAQAQQAAANV